MDDEEVQNTKPVSFGVLLEKMSIKELNDHILELEKEIARARHAISSKETARGAADSVFK